MAYHIGENIRNYLQNIFSLSKEDAMSGNAMTEISIDEQKDVVLLNSLVHHLRNFGLQVSTDFQEAQRELTAQRVLGNNEQADFSQTYGFVKNGVIYLNPDIATSETPIHEYTHLWAEGLRMSRPQEWQDIVALMKGATELWNKVREHYPELKTDDAIADEVLAQYSGKHGKEKLLSDVQDLKDTSILEKIGAALEKFWALVSEILHIKTGKSEEPTQTKEQLADRILKDLLEGYNPIQNQSHPISTANLKEMAYHDRIGNMPRVVYDTLSNELGKETTEALSKEISWFDYAPDSSHFSLGWKLDTDLTSNYDTVETMLKEVYDGSDLHEKIENARKEELLKLLVRGTSLKNEMFWQRLPDPLLEQFYETDTLEEQAYEEMHSQLVYREDARQTLKRATEAYVDFRMAVHRYLGIDKQSIEERLHVLQGSHDEIKHLHSEALALYNNILATMPDSVYDRYRQEAINFETPLYGIRMQKASTGYMNNVREVDWHGKMNVYSSSTYIPVRTLCHKVKDGDQAGIKQASNILAALTRRVPDYQNAVLVPIPNRTGYAGYTLELAQRISEQTGLPVADVLIGKPHTPIYNYKVSQGIDGLDLIGYDLKKDLPKNKRFILVDNVADTCTTAMSAMRTLGKDASLVVIGHTNNSKHFNYPIEIQQEDVSNIFLSEQRSKNIKEALTIIYTDHYKENPILPDLIADLKQSDMKTWNDVRDFSLRLSFILTSNIEHLGERFSQANTESKEICDTLYKIDATERLFKDINKQCPDKIQDITKEDLYNLSNESYNQKIQQIILEQRKEAIIQFARKKEGAFTDCLPAIYNLKAHDGRNALVYAFRIAPDPKEPEITLGHHLSEVMNKRNTFHLQDFSLEEQLRLADDILSKLSLNASMLSAQTYLIENKQINTPLNVELLNNKTMTEKEEQAQQQQKPKNDWKNYDYSKNAMPEGVKVEQANVFKINAGENAGQWAVSALINGERKTAKLYNNDVTNYFEKDNEGHLTKRVTADMLIAKYFAKAYFHEQKKEEQPMQEKPTDNQTTKLVGTYDIPVSAVPYLANGTDGLEGLDAEDVREILDFEKTLPTPHILNFPDDIDAAKEFIQSPAFGKAADCIKMDVYQVIQNQSEDKDKKQKEAKQAEVDRQNTVKEENDKIENEKEKERQKQQEESEKDEKDIIPVAQTALLITALSAATVEDRVWMNKDGKTSPDLAQKGLVVSPFNAMTMNLHSDANGYQTNIYTTFDNAKQEGYNIRRGATAIPFNWYKQDNYVNRYDSNDVIAKEAYSLLPEPEKEMYMPLSDKKVLKIFNIDQTLMKHQQSDKYESYLPKEHSDSEENQDKEHATEQAESNILKQYNDLKKKHPDALLLFRAGDFYETYHDDAEKTAQILGITLTKSFKIKDKEGKALKMAGFPYHALDSYLPKLIRAGQRVAICDQLENPNMQEHTPSAILYGKLSDFIKQLQKEDKEHVVTTTLHDTGYANGVLTINVNSKSVPGLEMTLATEHTNDIYRAVAAYVADSSRLNIGSKGKMLPEDADKYKQLIQELSAGVLMSRLGMPAKISQNNLQHIPYWQRELREDPALINHIERDLNNTVKVISAIQQGKANEIDYNTIRGEKPTDVLLPKQYTIATQIAKLPDIDKKLLVLVKDAENKSVDVVLPEGASLKMGEDIQGMNKNRILTALIKEGYEGEKVQWYNAGGAFALQQPNEYFKDKEVEVSRLKQYTLIPTTQLDLSKEIARTSEVDIVNVQMIKDDDGKWALYVAPSKDFGEPFTIYPEKNDVSRFFEALKNGDANVSAQLGQKYYALVNAHPDLKANIIMPEVVDEEVKARITRVNIFKSKNKENTIMLLVAIDGKTLPPKELNKQQYQRLFLASDMKAYKIGLAAQLFSNELKQVQEEKHGEQQVTEHKSGVEHTDENEHQEAQGKTHEEEQKEEEKHSRWLHF